MTERFEDSIEAGGTARPVSPSPMPLRPEERGFLEGTDLREDDEWTSFVAPDPDIWRASDDEAASMAEERRKSGRFSRIRQSRVGRIATSAALGFATGWTINNVNPLSDASNIKAGIATTGLLFSGAVLGQNDWSEFGKAVKPTVIGIGGAAVAGFAAGNMFTGGWFEKGPIIASTMAGVAAGGLALGIKSKEVLPRRTKSKSVEDDREKVGIWNRAKEKFNKTLTTPKSRKVAKGLGAGATTLAVAETSNILNWPFGGFNNVGAAAAAVIAGLTVGGFGYVKERYDDMTDSHKKKAKIAAVALGATALVGGYFAWKHGIIGGHNHSKSGAGDHTDKIPTGKGGTTTTEATTTGGGGTTTTVATTAPGATPIPGGTGGTGSSFTLQSFSAANKPGMVAKIQELQPGISAPKANSIADQIITGQYKGVTEQGDKFAKFIEAATQQQADNMFAHDVSVLAAA